MIQFLVVPVIIFIVLIVQGGASATSAIIISLGLEMSRVFSTCLMRGQTETRMRRSRLHIESAIISLFVMSVITFTLCSIIFGNSSTYIILHRVSIKVICFCFLFAEVISGGGIFLSLNILDLRKKIIIDRSVKRTQRSDPPTKRVFIWFVVFGSIWPCIIIYAVGNVPDIEVWWIHNGAYMPKVLFLASYYMIATAINWWLALVDKRLFTAPIWEASK